MEEYVLVASGDAAKFQTLANEHVKNGFEPVGGVSVAMAASINGSIHYNFAQGFIRKKELKP